MTVVTRSSAVESDWWCRSMKFKGMSTDLTRRTQNERNNFEIEHDNEIEITKFAGILCKSLE